MTRCKSGLPSAAIVVQKAEYDQVRPFNLFGNWVERSEISITDLDHDGYKEIIGFTVFRDTIWIHIMEPLQETGLDLHLPVTGVRHYYGGQYPPAEHPS